MVRKVKARIHTLGDVEQAAPDEVLDVLFLGKIFSERTKNVSE